MNSFQTLNSDARTLVYQYASRPDLEAVFPEDRNLVCKGRIQEIRSYAKGSFIQEMGEDLAPWRNYKIQRNFKRVERFENRVAQFIELGKTQLTPEELQGIDLEKCGRGDLAEIDVLGNKILAKRDRALLQFFQWLQEQPGMDEARAFWLTVPEQGKAESIRNWLREHRPNVPDLSHEVVNEWAVVPMELIDLNLNHHNAAVMGQQCLTRKDLSFLCKLIHSNVVGGLYVAGFLSYLIENGHRKIFAMILERLGTRIGTEWLTNAILTIIRENDKESFEIFRKNVGFNRFSPWVSAWGHVFLYACKCGRLDFVKFFFSHLYPRDKETDIQWGLLTAIRNDQSEVVKFLSPHISTKGMLWAMKEPFKEQAGGMVVMALMTGVGYACSRTDRGIIGVAAGTAFPSGLLLATRHLAVNPVAYSEITGLEAVIKASHPNEASVQAIYELGRKAFSSLLN